MADKVTVKEKKQTLKILCIVSAAVIAIIAIILRSLVLKSNHSAIAVGLFISSLLVFTAAIILAFTGKELPAMCVVLFSEILPVVSGFIFASKSVGSKEFGDLIKSNPYGFASIFIMVYLFIILSLLLRFKAFESDRSLVKKWAFIPVVLLAVFMIVFQAVDGFEPFLGRIGVILPLVSITISITYLAYVSGAILSFAWLFLVPFHLGEYANNTNVTKDGYNITFWAIGLLYMILSLAWLIYEIYYYFKKRN